MLLGAVKNTVILGAGVAIGGGLTYALISYVVSRTQLKGRGVLDFITWLPWAVPGLVLALGILWAYVGGIGMVLPFVLYGTLWIMILAIIVKEFPLGMRIMNASMVQFSKELEEAAWIHGASFLYSFRRIVAPLLKPAFISVLVVIFLAAIRDLVTVVLLYSPKSRVLSTLMLDYWQADAQGRAMVVGLMLTTMVIIFAVLSRFLGGSRESGM